MVNPAATDLAVLFHRLGPYHRARLDALGQRARVTAVELAGETRDYDWDRVAGAASFERVTLFPGRDSRDVALGPLTNRLESALDRLAPQVVAVPGWSARGALAALRWSRRTGTPAVVMSASTAQDAPRVWWKEWIKQRVVRQFDAGLGGGTRHAAYLRALELPPGRVFDGYDVVDNDHFADGAAAARQDAAATRAKYALPRRYFLAVCRFLPKKNLHRLLRAFAQYRRARPNGWDLVLLGDGPLAGDVRRWRRELGLKEAVALPGFEQYDALPAYYGLAGAFVHASTSEQWGLVVNEAMAAGLPVVVSQRCGCAPDLVENSKNGFAFDPFDVDELAACLLRVAGGDTDRAAMGRASRRIVARWTPATFAENLLRAARTAKETSRRSFSLPDRALLYALLRLQS